MRLFAALIVLQASVALADANVDRAAEREKAGRTLMDKGEYRDALTEFAAAQRLAPGADLTYLMATCEYKLSMFKEARGHYRSYLDQGASPKLRETARERIEDIERLPGRVIVYSDPPEDVQFRFEGGPEPVAGAGPEFSLPIGKYRVTASRRNYQTASGSIVVDPGEAKPVFFRLKPLPAHIEVRTKPRNATLYVRGNRALNPYVQQVEPGSYEIYAEAVDHRPVRQIVDVSPGEDRVVEVALPYVQRSGRPELIGFWTAAGAIAGSTAVLARLERVGTEGNTASASLVLAGALAGGTAAAVIATAAAPNYIPDNLALFRIGTMWIGAFEGATMGLAASDRSTAAGWVGGVIGLGGGALTGVLLDNRAPTYGRAALLQSFAGWGLVGGAAVVPAVLPHASTREDVLRWEPFGMLIGLNVGLGAGLAATYLPDQREYGPSWQRVALVDLSALAGAFAGAVATTIDDCLTHATNDCHFDRMERQTTARTALAGALIGATAGYLLTRNFDKGREARLTAPGALTMPVPAAIPVQTSDGTTTLVPGIATQGRF